uniref:RAD52 motif containing 1 n=1 Tax=Oryctolagus cuniculus TaxID=9986 RepID=A0A5F9CLF7_RABIT|nr:RAD52 motif-containing protein 1 isoform X2 [Oryctolagus cuniculus]
MAEVVPFAVPTESDKTLLVWELSCGPSAEDLQRSLFAAFSRFGLLYSVRVFPNAAVAGPGFYAIIKFYSARDARRAQAACDRKLLFQETPVKVRLGTRHKAVQHQALALNGSRCQELANYYLGFNGWSKRIIKLQELSALEERENEETARRLAERSLKVFCALEVVLPSYECSSRGVGVAEEPLDTLQEEGPLLFLMKKKTAQNLAIQKALSNAFQKLSIVVLVAFVTVTSCSALVLRLIATLLFLAFRHLAACGELKTARILRSSALPEPSCTSRAAHGAVLLHRATWCNRVACAAGLCVPLLASHIWRCTSRPVMSGPGLCGPTAITNADILMSSHIVRKKHGAQ